MQKPKPTAHIAVLQTVRKVLSTPNKDAESLLFDLKEKAQLYQRLCSEETQENPDRFMNLWNQMEQLRQQLKRRGCNLNAFNLEEVIPAILKIQGDQQIKTVRRESPAPLHTEGRKIPKKEQGDIWEKASKVFRN